MAVMPVLGSILLIQFTGAEGCIVTSMLSYPILRFIGRISYSLYLWHWPVIVLGHAAQVRWENIPDWPFIILIPVLAISAYYAVELPGRHLRNPLPAVVPGACMVLAVSFYLTSLKTNFDFSRLAPTVAAGGAYTVNPRPTARLEGAFKAMLDGVTLAIPDPQYTNAYRRGGIIKRYGGENVDVLLLGDSHAGMWAPVIDEICQERHLTVLFYVAEGVDPFPPIPAIKRAEGPFRPDEGIIFDSNRVGLIKEHRPHLIIMAFRFYGFAVDAKAIRFLREVSNLRRSSDNTPQSEVLFIEDPPELALAGVSAPDFFSTTSATTCRTQGQSAQQAAVSELRSLSQKYGWVYTVQTADLYLTKSDRVRARNGNTLFYIDANHLSLAGAELAKERIGSAMARVIGAHSLNEDHSKHASFSAN
jgi:hypothetical protein